MKIRAPHLEAITHSSHISPEIWKKYESVHAQALAAMHELEQGSPANPSEGRMVGHFWLRDPEQAPSDEISTSIHNTQTEIQDFVTAKSWKQILIIGCGGSSLGSQLLAGISAHASNITWWETPDAFSLHTWILTHQQHLRDTLWIFASKSGRTREVEVIRIWLHNTLRTHNIDLAAHAIAITTPGSELESSMPWHKIFPIWPWVGGRYSIFSAVGLLPASLMKLDTHALLAGAQAMDQHTRTPENLALWLATWWHELAHSHNINTLAIIPYRENLRTLPRYLQQLLMESLGKQDAKSFTVYGNFGPADSHGYAQRLCEGPVDSAVILIRTLETPSDDTQELTQCIEHLCLGLWQALIDAKRPCICLQIPVLNEYSLAALIALFERAVGFYASMQGINAYDQPGVQAIKSNAQKVSNNKYEELHPALRAALNLGAS